MRTEAIMREPKPPPTGWRPIADWVAMAFLLGAAIGATLATADAWWGWSGWPLLIGPVLAVVANVVVRWLVRRRWGRTQ